MSTTDDWDDLMRAGLAGDRSALVKLLTALRAPLFAFIYRICRNPEIAEDLLQETLIIVCTRGATWDPARPLRPWVYTVARNQFHEWRRRARKIVPLLRPETVAAPAAGTQPSADRVLLQQVLVSLSEPIREAFLLKHHARLPFAEVAAVQGVPVPTAKSRVRFAVEKLREMLGDSE